MSLVGPAAICRLDDQLLERIRSEDRTGAVAMSAVGTILLGGGAYGIALGIWRAPVQAVYSAIKLPTLLLSIAGCTFLLGAMLASVLRSKLSMRQTILVILLSFAVTSAVLGALGPVAILVALVAPPPDPIALGLAIDDPRAASSVAVARSQVVVHVAVIAFAGIVGVIRLREVLARLGLGPDVRRRVLVGFLAAQLVVGVQLSWLLRPFLGRPHLPPTFSCDDPFEGNFFEELAVAIRPAFGSAAPLVLGYCFAAAALAALVAVSRRTATRSTDVELGPAGFALRDTPMRHVSWAEIAFVRDLGTDVLVTLHPDHTLAAEVMRIGCPDETAAHDLARRIDTERATRRDGPFRTRVESR